MRSISTGISVISLVTKREIVSICAISLSYSQYMLWNTLRMRIIHRGVNGGMLYLCHHHSFKRVLHRISQLRPCYVTKTRISRCSVVLCSGYVVRVYYTSCCFLCHIYLFKVYVSIRIDSYMAEPNFKEVRSFMCVNSCYLSRRWKIWPHVSLSTFQRKSYNILSEFSSRYIVELHCSHDRLNKRIGTTVISCKRKTPSCGRCLSSPLLVRVRVMYLRVITDSVCSVSYATASSDAVSGTFEGIWDI